MLNIDCVLNIYMATRERNINGYRLNKFYEGHIGSQQYLDRIDH